MGEKKKENRLEGIIEKWKEYMKKLLEPHTSKFPKMEYCSIMNYDLIKKMHKGTASTREIKK